MPAGRPGTGHPAMRRPRPAIPQSRYRPAALNRLLDHDDRCGCLCYAERRPVRGFAVPVSWLRPLEEVKVWGDQELEHDLTPVPGSGDPGWRQTDGRGCTDIQDGIRFVASRIQAGPSENSVSVDGMEQDCHGGISPLPACQTQDPMSRFLNLMPHELRPGDDWDDRIVKRVEPGEAPAEARYDCRIVFTDGTHEYWHTDAPIRIYRPDA
jgi:hypothetical protein